MTVAAAVASASLVVTACSSDAPTATRTYPTGPEIAYISNSFGVVGPPIANWVPFNLVSHAIGHPFPDPRLEAVAIAPGGRKAYGVSAYGIVVIDLATGTVGRPFSPVHDCQSISVGGSARTLYLAGCGNSAAAMTGILPVDVRTGVAGRALPGAGDPYAVSVSPDGRTGYVNPNGGATLTEVRLATGTVTGVITVPEGAGDLAITRDGAMAYATGNDDEVIGNRQYSYVTPIDLRTGTAEAPIALLHDPYGIALAPDGRTAFVTGGTAGPPTPPDVTEIDLVTGRVRATFTIPGGADGIVGASS